LGILTCAVALLALPLGSAAGAEAADDVAHPGGAFAALGHTVFAGMMSATNADEALNALGDSLVLMEAREKIVADAEAKAAAAPQPQSPTAEEIAADPSKLPPASAGSNGTTSAAAATARGEIFAHSRAGANPGSSNAILLTGVALAPPDAPQVVKDVINNANLIVGRPYVWGGGHSSFYSSGYDCSGSVSFALFGGGLIPRPLASGELEGWGAPGPGKWITVYANAGHTFAEIAGLRWDTVGDEQGTGPRWHLAPTSGDGFAVRHPPGL
jgi:cell wall-associated NlpC family hydrolase